MGTRDYVANLAELPVGTLPRILFEAVDRFGDKLAEFRREDLAQQIVQGNAGILDFGVAFDDTLQNLITERNKKPHFD